MTLAEVKARVGDRICLKGNLDDMAFLALAPEEEVRAAAEACIAQAAEAGMDIFRVFDSLNWMENMRVSIDAIREACPGIIINQTTGVMDDDVSGPIACLRRLKPEIAACNAGSLNYLKLKKDGTWAWPPMVFLNSVEKVQKMLDAMADARVPRRPRPTATRGTTASSHHHPAGSVP